MKIFKKNLKIIKNNNNTMIKENNNIIKKKIDNSENIVNLLLGNKFINRNTIDFISIIITYIIDIYQKIRNYYRRVRK